jgi:poly(beta-D-mannuronate) lyase
MNAMVVVLKRIYFVFLILFFIVISCDTSPNPQKIIKNIEEFDLAVKEAQPNDVIVLANGEWKDTELLFEGYGTADKPITLRAEERGKVILTGASNLRLAGEYLIVEGLVFKNGFTPTGSVISFRKDENNLANHSRLTECVIDNFSNPERQESDYWIELYGKYNRVDHNHIAGKRNLGVTMAVRLTSEESQENHHQIDHNYFGPRPNLGSNGGETLRIGTSHFSLTNSNTIVESNYFDRCNGEHEIISNKSCQNTYKNNVFYECTGTLTMRHGNETLVEGNVFLGNGKPSTGGIRIINAKQTVINNYAYGLTGYRFRGAFVIMNGVPNSPINRYHQAADAIVKNNTFINCDHIQFCAGSDEERSATPINSLMADNLFYHDYKSNLFTVYDDISGISFENNLVSPNIKTNIEPGFLKTEMELVTNEQGFLIPNSKELKSPIKISPDIATLENTGVRWYSKKEPYYNLNSGKGIVVKPALNSLFEAVKNAKAGDILQLNPGETYLVSKIIVLDKPLSILGDSKNKPTILFEKNALFEIQNGGSLSIKAINFDGEKAPDYSGNSLIRTSKYSMNQNYKLFMDQCSVNNLDVNHSFDVLQVAKNTFADTISITNSSFSNITGNVLALDKEIDDKGIYNAEYVILKNNIFKDVQGQVLNLYRGGTDESTFGPFLEIDHCVFDHIGNGKRNKSGTAISLHGVQENEITNNIFSNSQKMDMYLVVGEPIVHILNNNVYNTPMISIRGDQKYKMENIWQFDPDFTEDGTYQLRENSPLKSKATDQTNLGIQNP